MAKIRTSYAKFTLIVLSICEGVVIPSSSENERSSSVIFSCKTAGCSKKMRCQLGEWRKRFRVCVGPQKNVHISEIFLCFTVSKITEKVELTKSATGKTAAFLF